MANGDFTVVIPAYKAAGTLDRALQSTLAQTRPAAEIIVVDDCSPDDQASVAAKYPVTYLRRATNGGESAAKNTGVQAAATEWVVTLDADDAWARERLERIGHRIEQEPAIDIVTTDAWVEPEGQVTRAGSDSQRSPWRYYGGPTGARWAEGDQRFEILRRNFIFSHAAVRRSRWLAVGGMDESRLDVAADWALWVRMIFAGARAALVDEPLAYYVLTTGSLSDSATTAANTAVAAFTAALGSPECTGEYRGVAEQQLAAARRNLVKVGAWSELWAGAAKRLTFARIALDPGYRKVDRAQATLAALSPSVARRRLAGNPDALPRDR